MTTITDLQARIGAINIANGWRTGPEDTGRDALADQLHRIGLISSENSEAIEEIRAGRAVDETYYSDSKIGPKLEGVPSELADIAIRILDTADAWQRDLAPALARLTHEPNEPVLTLADIAERGQLERHNEDMVLLFGPTSAKDAIGALTLLLAPLGRATERLIVEGIGAGVDAELAYALVLTMRAAKVWDIDLDAVIDEKLLYNTRRGYRHDGKAA